VQRSWQNSESEVRVYLATIGCNPKLFSFEITVCLQCTISVQVLIPKVHPSPLVATIHTFMILTRGGWTLYASGINLGTSLRKLAGSSFITYRSWSQPNPGPKLIRIAKKHQFGVLNWLRDAIKYAFDYIPGPI